MSDLGQEIEIKEKEPTKEAEIMEVIRCSKRLKKYTDEELDKALSMLETTSGKTGTFVVKSEIPEGFNLTGHLKAKKNYQYQKAYTDTTDISKGPYVEGTRILRNGTTG